MLSIVLEVSVKSSALYSKKECSTAVCVVMGYSAQGEKCFQLPKAIDVFAEGRPLTSRVRTDLFQGVAAGKDSKTVERVFTVN